MADSSFLSQKRYAVVTGGNRGIGFEICRQLALKGVVVILTARDENKGREAVEKLRKGNLLVEFHQLDITDPTSVASLADFIKIRFGKLDILVNNAGVLGAIVNYDALRATPEKPREEINYEDKMIQPYELAEECINVNYYAVKRTIEALLPLVLLSDSGRIVNVSSELGELKNIPNERVRDVLNNVEDLKEEKVDEILSEFLKDFREGKIVEKGWPPFFTAYTMSKAALNAYTRIVSKIYHPRIDINSVSPGFTKTDMTNYAGILSVEEGAESPVWVALLPRGESSGLFYTRKDVASF